MKIVNVKITELKAYENNPRRISDKAIDVVANSIREFDFKVPCIVTSDNVIVAGHTRVQAAQKLGLKEVPCVIADDLSPEQIKAFRLIDNKSSELTGWDFEKLDLELEELSDFNIGDFGFEIKNDDIDISQFFTRTEDTPKVSKEVSIEESNEIDETNETNNNNEVFITCPECGAKIKI